MKTRKLTSVILLASSLLCAPFAFANSTVSESKGAFLIANDSKTPVSGSVTFESGASYTLATDDSGYAVLVLPQGSIRLEPKSRVVVSAQGVQLVDGRVQILSSNGLVIQTPETSVTVSGQGTIGTGLKDGLATTTVVMQSGSASVGGSSIEGGFGADVTPAGVSSQVAGGPQLPSLPAQSSVAGLTTTDGTSASNNAAPAPFAAPVVDQQTTVSSTQVLDALNPSNIQTGVRGRGSR